MFKRVLKRFIKNLLNENEIKVSNPKLINPRSDIDNCKLEGNVIISSNVKLVNCLISGNIKIEENASISDAQIQGSVLISNNVRILGGVSLYGEIEIGRNTTLNGPNTDLRCALNKISIGNFCSIARNVVFQEYNHDITRMTSYLLKRNLEKKTFKEDIISKGAIVIGNDVWIGTHSVILSGVTIGTGAVIAANSVVNENIPPYAIVAGSPAKVIKYRFNKEVIEFLLHSKWWEMNDKQIIDFYNNFNNGNFFKESTLK